MYCISGCQKKQKLRLMELAGISFMFCFSQCCVVHSMQYHVILDHVVMLPNCMYMDVTWLNVCSGIISSMRPPNERWRYNVTSSLIGWVHVMIMSCHRYAFRITCPLCEESTNQLFSLLTHSEGNLSDIIAFPSQRANYAELCGFLWC